MIKTHRKEKNHLSFVMLISVCLLLVLLTNSVIQGHILRGVRPLIRSIEYQIVSFQVRNFNQLETENFIIKYENIDEEILNLVAYTAESKYKQTVDIFKYEPNKKVTLILYDEAEPMMDITMLRKGTPPMGVYYGDTLHILDPTHWVKDADSIEKLFYSEGPVLHELVHLFTDHLGRGNFPTWFTEGVSLYFEYEIDGYEWGHWVAFEDDEYTLHELTHSFYELDQFLAYTRSFRIVKNYVKDYGLDALVDLIRSLGEGDSLTEYYYLFRY